LGVAVMLSRCAPISSVFALAGSTSTGHAERAKEASLTARQVMSPWYSNTDRETLLKQRHEMYEDFSKMRNKPMADQNWEKMPEIKDVFNRALSGDGTVDPIGGRKKYTMNILYRRGDDMNNANSLKIAILKHMWFFQKKMSGRDIKVYARKSPIDGAAITTLEYPMAQYGELPRDQKIRKTYSQATFVQFDMTIPAAALKYIEKELYSDNNVLRFRFTCHTGHFSTVGEDNELHL